MVSQEIIIVQPCVIIDHELKFSSHCNVVVAKAKRVANIILRSFSTRKPVILLFILLLIHTFYLLNR